MENLNTVRLMVDRMLEGLARRLRLAGYDCALPPEVFRTPQAILERARAEGRPLLTTSGAYAEMAAPGEILRLPEGSPAMQARQVLAHYPIDVAALAFTRCSRDNAPLEDAPEEVAAAQLPPRVRQAGLRPVRRCPVCGRLYWPGSHWQRMRRQFESWTGHSLGNP